MADLAARTPGRPRTKPAPDGYYEPAAVEARRAYMVAYKAVHADRLRLYYRGWQASNPEKHRQYNREWAARDRARRAHAAANPAAEAEPAEPADIPPEFVPEPVD